MTTPPNPLQLANTAQQTARYAPMDDAVVSNMVAMLCMGVMAASSLVQMLQPLLRDLNNNLGSENRRRRRRSRQLFAI